MFRVKLDRRIIGAGFFPFSSWFKNNSNEPPTTPKISKIQIMTDKFYDCLYDNNGSLSKEAQAVTNITIGALIVGMFIGGIQRAKTVPTIYKAENQATLYNHRFEAARDMHAKTAVGFIKGGVRYALKMGCFCFLFSAISASLYIYRKKHDIWNYIFGGAITGSIFKVHMGLKGITSGFIFGTSLGTLYGAITIFLLSITGTKMEDLYEAHYQLIKLRRDKIEENMRAMMSSEKSELVKMHEHNLKMKKTLDKEQV